MSQPRIRIKSFLKGYSYIHDLHTLNYTMNLMTRYKKNDVSIDQSLIASHGHGDVYQLANKAKKGGESNNQPINPCANKVHGNQGCYLVYR
jgi:hypothetical protein